MTNTVEELRKCLKSGVVNFTYTKKDGTIREAKGTTRMNNIPEENRPKGVRESPSGIVNYFDLDKSEWRSFREENFEEINNFQPAEPAEEPSKPI